VRVVEGHGGEYFAGAPIACTAALCGCSGSRSARGHGFIEWITAGKSPKSSTATGIRRIKNQPLYVR
jgi:hypothetical protein